MGKLAINGGKPLLGENEAKVTPWPPLSDATEAKIIEVYRSRKWSFNSESEQSFENAYSAFHDTRYGILMSNGTVTLECALAALGVTNGDEVIVPSLTWPATAMAVRYVGGTIVFADIEKDTMCLDPAAFEAAITPKTKAVIPVHLYGSMANLDAIIAIADKHGIAVLEDCAHMQGGKWNGRGVGSWGRIGSFSFQQSKTLSGGESGICITNDPELADLMYRLKHIGYSRNDAQGGAKTPPPTDLCCHNYRGLAIQAVIMEGQIAGVPAYLEACSKFAKATEEACKDIPGVAFQKPGLKATRQGYYARGIGFTGDMWKGIAPKYIVAALKAEGMKWFTPTYGIVRKHMLFNLSQKYWRNAGDPVAEAVCASSIVTMHMLMSASGAAEQVADALHKLAANVEELREYAKSQQ
jgi:dTDP-4-amino-4,6-dideoxygalactose transaminase